MHCSRQPSEGWVGERELGLGGLERRVVTNVGLLDGMLGVVCMGEVAREPVLKALGEAEGWGTWAPLVVLRGVPEGWLARVLAVVPEDSGRG